MKAGLIQSLSPALTGAQRRMLRGMAHGMKPIVQIGHDGPMATVIAQLCQALYDHELVKVKVNSTYEGSLEEVAVTLAERTASACVQQIGHILLFYKANPDEPIIDLKPLRGGKGARNEM